jgi:hypothetical protein
MDYPNPSGYTNIKGLTSYSGCVGCKWRRESGWCDAAAAGIDCDLATFPAHTDKLQQNQLLDWPKDA